MASVKCPKCGGLINGVQAGQTVKCTKCGYEMKLSSGTGTQTNTSYRQQSQKKIKSKGIGIALIVIGIIGILMGLMMFGDIGIACIVGALSALLSGIGFVKISD